MADTLQIFGTKYTNVAGIIATTPTETDLTYIRPQGTKSISANGAGIDVAAYASVDVSVSGSLDMPTFTVTWDAEYTQVLSVTCDKTYSEVYNYINSSKVVAIVRETNGESAAELMARFEDFDNFSSNSNSIKYFVYIDTTGYSYDIVYSNTGTLTAISPSSYYEVLNVTANGTYAPSTYYSIINQVNVNVPSTTPTLQNKTVSPSESQQSIQADSGYDGLGTVTVNAISSTYVGSGITQCDSDDLTVFGATVTAPAGYYSAAAQKSVASGSASAPSSISDTSASVTTGTNTLTLTKTVSVTPVVSAGYVSSGTATNSSVSLTASIPVNPTVTASGATVTIPTGYYTTQTTKSVASGSATAPSTISGTAASVSTGTNTLTLTKTVSVTPTVSAGYVSSGTAGDSSVSLTASVTVDPTPSASGATVTIPAGYYTEQTTKSVSSGSATGPSSLSGSSATVSTGTNTLTLTKTGVTTTPTVSAGYVSSATASTATVTLTASVTTKAAATITPTTTNQTIAAGTYLTGTQTIAGDADLVASNIVSGVEIFGVAGNVVLQNYYTGSSTPASSLGSNGDIYLQT